MPNSWQRDLGMEFLVAICEAITVNWIYQVLCMLQGKDSLSEILMYRVSHVGVGILAWGCWLLGGTTRSHQWGPAGCCTLKGDISPWRVCQSWQSLWQGKQYVQWVSVPLRSISAYEGRQCPAELSAATRGVRLQQEYQALTGVTVPTRGFSPWRGYQSLQGVSVCLRTVTSDPCKLQPECNQ